MTKYFLAKLPSKLIIAPQLFKVLRYVNFLELKLQLQLQNFSLVNYNDNYVQNVFNCNELFTNIIEHNPDLGGQFLA